ncbi:MAG: MBL fold metallo-hydrolase [Balneola sp.]|nr:MAG: MBL fold metallo-hydrolase [Balneola sp.]
MKVTFLGTGTSMGVPVAGGFKRKDLAHDPRNERTRCSVWIKTNETSLLIDVGPEFRIQSIRSEIEMVDYVLLTHEHMDHVAGLDDLRMYSYLKKGPLPLYSTSSALESIKKRFDYLFGPDKYPGSASIDLRIADEPFLLNDLSITPLPVMHGDLEILGFRVNDFSYLTDVKEIPSSTKELIKGSKAIVISALRWEPSHPTHLTIPEAVDIINDLGVPEAYLIHMNSYVDHEPTNKRLPKHIRLAYDLLTIEM